MRRAIILAFLLFFLPGVLCAAQSGETFQITGTVVDGNDGTPVGRCQVLIAASHPEEYTRHAPLPETVVTAEDGRFQFNNVPAGKYSLVARHNGYRTQTLNEHDGFNSAVAVGPGKDSQNIIFRLQRSASISGRVEDEYGDPVSDGQASLFLRAPLRGKALAYPRGRVNLDQNGVYHFFRLVPGEYFVVVLAKPWYARFREFPQPQNGDQPVPPRPDNAADVDVTFPITYYSGASDASSATSIKLHPGERFTADMRLAAIPGFHLRTMKPESDSAGPIDRHLQAMVFGVAMNIDPLVNVMNDATQTDITGVPAGQYRLRDRITAGDAGSSEARAEVEISPGGDVENKNASKGTPVTGKVVLEGVNEPLLETAMQFQRLDTAEMMQVRVLAKGELVPFQLFPGVYFYGALSSQGVIKSFKADGAKVIARTFEVGSNPINLSVVLADVAVDVEGTVVSSDGKPLSGAMVVIVPEDPEHNENIIRRDQSDTDGTFKLRVVMPGRWSPYRTAGTWNGQKQK